MKNNFLLLTLLIFILVVVFVVFNFLTVDKFNYQKELDLPLSATFSDSVKGKKDIQENKEKKEYLNSTSVENVETPNVMRAIYSTMWSIGSKNKRDYFFDLLENTDLNSIIIDVKGSEGELIFDQLHIEDIIDEFHKKGVYVIARIVVFQNSGLAKTNPELVLKDKNGEIWRDKKGYAWADPASKDVWDKLINISKQAIDAGFDEINYDYIRFPTDGNLDDIVYPFWDKEEDKSEIIRKFSEYSKNKLKKYNPNVKLSLDIFGYTFLRGNGLGIGQKLPYMLDNFDYVYPMVYPSHFGPGNFGFTNPADYPYEVVNLTLQQGLNSLGDKKEEARKKIRPWIQVFDLGAKYTPDMIEAQIKATYDVLGFENTGWLMWSPSNKYDEVLEIDL